MVSPDSFDGLNLWKCHRLLCRGPFQMWKFTVWGPSFTLSATGVTLKRVMIFLSFSGTEGRGKEALSARNREDWSERRIETQKRELSEEKWNWTSMLYQNCTRYVTKLWFHTMFHSSVLLLQIHIKWSRSRMVYIKDTYFTKYNVSICLCKVPLSGFEQI